MNPSERVSFWGKAPSSEASDHHILSDQIQGRKRGGQTAVSLTGLGEWFFAGVQPKKIARGRSLMSFIFVQKMSGIDTESIMGCKLVKL
ncbi:hypothetical protein J4727_20455 [Providencia rettgeri]|uniref:Uncharacterized protein n=1 Tax=Providencia rettgeri TaxID=587 RepID=A0A939NBP8_PRORE|nr:hypothetical protein [Providencia rettgeri]